MLFLEAGWQQGTLSNEKGTAIKYNFVDKKVLKTVRMGIKTQNDNYLIDFKLYPVVQKILS